MSLKRITFSISQPECQPNIVAHYVQPKKTNKDADIGNVSCRFAQPFYLQQLIVSQIKNSEAEIQNHQGYDVAHQAFSMKIS